MFMTPKDMPNPFTTKIMKTVNQALTEDKPSPSLREREFTSFLFPADLEVWLDVTSTFSVGRLSLDCSSQQFSEGLPKLPDNVIAKEFEARSRLA